MSVYTSAFKLVRLIPRLDQGPQPLYLALDPPVNPQDKMKMNLLFPRRNLMIKKKSEALNKKAEKITARVIFLLLGLFFLSLLVWSNSNLEASLEPGEWNDDVGVTQLVVGGGKTFSTNTPAKIAIVGCPYRSLRISILRSTAAHTNESARRWIYGLRAPGRCRVTRTGWRRGASRTAGQRVAAGRRRAASRTAGQRVTASRRRASA